MDERIERRDTVVDTQGALRMVSVYYEVSDGQDKEEVVQLLQRAKPDEIPPNIASKEIIHSTYREEPELRICYDAVLPIAVVEVTG